MVTSPTGNGVILMGGQTLLYFKKSKAMFELSDSMEWKRLDQTLQNDDLSVLAIPIPDELVSRHKNYKKHYQSILPNITGTSNQPNATIPVVPPIRRPLGSIPEDLNNISELIHTSSGQKQSNVNSATTSVSVIETNVKSKSKKSRQDSYLSQENILSPSKKRCRTRK